MSRARAFTLLEVAIALALFGVVIGVAAGVMATVLTGNRRARVHSEMQRDGALVSQLLNSELRQAGLGVPRPFDALCNEDGFHIKRACGPGGGCTSLYGTSAGTAVFARFDTSVILATATEVGIVGDLPRPDGQYSTYGPLHSRATGVLGHTAETIVWHSENNGSCAPGNGCTVTDDSLFFSGAVADVCSVANANARTCPWGAGRVRGGEAIQIVAGDGAWSTAHLADPLTVIDVGGGRLAVALSPGFDINETTDPPVNTPGSFSEDGVWRNLRNGDGPGGIAGQGWVTTLDRIFFQFDDVADVILRTQCFGDPDPAHVDWPPIGSNDAGSFGYTPTGGSAVTCVGPEIVARHVDAVLFTYENAEGTVLGTPITGAGACVLGGSPITGKNAVRRIAYSIRFRAKVDDVTDHDVMHTIQGSVRLQNL